MSLKPYSNEILKPPILRLEIMVPFWVPIIKRNVLFRVPQKGTIILTTTRVKAALMLRVRGLWAASRQCVCGVKRDPSGDTVPGPFSASL